jgi:hypothetical protein
MAVTYIPVDTAKSLGAQAKMAANMLGEARELVIKHKLIMDAMSSGGTEFTLVETEYGLATGQGAAFYALFGNAKAVIDVATVLSLVNNLG